MSELPPAGVVGERAVTDAAASEAAPAGASAAARESAPAGESPLADEPTPRKIVSSDRVFEGAVWDLVRDSFEYGGTTLTREYVDHPGAVAILALDDDGRVLLIKQYRHPIGGRDWELPAGLLDEHGESPVDGAARELAEEADLTATDWRLLAEFFTSPGGSNESIRIFLARGLAPTAEKFARFSEEADIETRWVDLDVVVQAVLARSVTNSILGFAVMAASASRAGGWASLGDPAQVWPWHPKLGDVLR